MSKQTNKQILGVIDATTDIESLRPIIHHRSVASLPFSGRYRLIDFMLSNMVHAGIDSVGIFAPYQNQSLKDHIGSGKVWDLDRKNGGLFFYAPPYEQEAFGSKSGFRHSIDFFLRSSHKYVVIANSYTLGRIPFLEVLNRHKETKADITKLTYRGKNLEIYMIERELLLQLFKKYEEGYYETLVDFIRGNALDLVTKDYEVNGHLMIIDSLESYYSYTMSLLNIDVWKEIFQKQYPIITKVKDEPPTKYFKCSYVKSSIIANGCIINGEVENSVIARGVKIGKNTIVRNCIIMPKTEIGDNCVLDGVIVDKEVKILDGVHLEATKKIPLVVPKGATIQGELIYQ